MSIYTLNISDEGTEQFLLRILDMLKYNPGLKMRQEGNQYFIERAEESGESEDANLKRILQDLHEIEDPDDNMMLPGKPMTWEELRKRQEESEQDIDKGLYKTTEQIRNESKNW